MTEVGQLQVCFSASVRLPVSLGGEGVQRFDWLFQMAQSAGGARHYAGQDVVEL